MLTQIVGRRLRRQLCKGWTALVVAGGGVKNHLEGGSCSEFRILWNWQLADDDDGNLLRPFKAPGS